VRRTFFFVSCPIQYLPRTIVGDIIPLGVDKVEGYATAPFCTFSHIGLYILSFRLLSSD